MASDKIHFPVYSNTTQTVPFESASEAWFWFIAAQEAKADGARVSAGKSETPRPCDPVDILRIVDRLYRQRFLIRDHLLVLRHYGYRHMAPDSRRPREVRAHKLWGEAMERLENIFERKGIVRKPYEFIPPAFMNVDFSWKGMGA